MSAAWFHVSDIPRPGAEAVIDGCEAKHASASRRLSAGDELVLFDGRGAVAQSQIIAIEPRGAAVHVQVLDRERQEPPRSITVAAALPKGDRLWTMLNMIAQLGVSTFVPLLCARSIVKPRPAMGDRAHRVFLEACKQSHRAFVPVMTDPQKPADLARDAADHGDRILLAHPTGNSLCAAADEADPDRAIVLMIGPEGGFAEEEVGAVKAAGGLIVSLGRATLRVETAAVAMLAAVQLA